MFLPSQAISCFSQILCIPACVLFPLVLVFIPASSARLFFSTDSCPSFCGHSMKLVNFLVIPVFFVFPLLKGAHSSRVHMTDCLNPHSKTLFWGFHHVTHQHTLDAKQGRVWKQLLLSTHGQNKREYVKATKENGGLHSVKVESHFSIV